MTFTLLSLAGIKLNGDDAPRAQPSTHSRSCFNRSGSIDTLLAMHFGPHSRRKDDMSNIIMCNTLG